MTTRGTWTPATRRALADLERARQGDGPAPRVDVRALVDLERQRSPLPLWLAIVLTALELVRDVLVFAPVAITWFHLREALPAYSTHVAAQIEANDLARADGRAGTDVASFLVAWQDQLEGVTPIASVALQVLVAIGLVMALSMILGLVRRSVEETRAARVDRLAGKLLGTQMALTAAASAPLDAEAADALHASLATSTATVQEGATSIALAGDRLLTAVDALGSDIDTLKEAAARLSDLTATKEEIEVARVFVREMQLLTHRSGQAADRSEAAVETLSTQLSETLQRLGRRETTIADAMGHMTECINTMERLMHLLHALESSVVVDVTEPTDA